MANVKMFKLLGVMLALMLIVWAISPFLRHQPITNDVRRGQDRSRPARGDEMRARRQAGRDPCADDRAGPAALSDRAAALLRLSGEHRGAQPSLLRRAEREDALRPAHGQVRSCDRHAPPAVEGRELQGPRPARRGRGAALRRGS